MEFARREDAFQILGPLGLLRANDSLTILAKTTPMLYAVLAWMGLPLAAAFAFQGALMNGLVHAPRSALEMAGIVAIAIPFLVIWIGGTFWFSIRRRISLTNDSLTFPKLLGDHVRYGYEEVSSIRAIDGVTVELAFRSGEKRRFSIFNPDEMNAYMSYVAARTGLTHSSRGAAEEIAAAKASSASRTDRRLNWVMLALSVFLASVLLPFAIRNELAEWSTDTDSGVVDSRAGGHSFAWLSLLPLVGGTMAVFGLRKKK